MSESTGSAPASLTIQSYAPAMTRSAASTASDVLARCHGWLVETRDGTVGRVETPLFPDARQAPDYLVLRTQLDHDWSFPIVPVSRITQIEPQRRRLTLDITAEEIERCPHRLPIT